jgi:hypothetical protein
VLTRRGRRLRFRAEPVGLRPFANQKAPHHPFRCNLLRVSSSKDMRLHISVSSGLINQVRMSYR